VSGVNVRDRVGLRRSQSTNITREPPWAISVAIARASVDLPSLGKHDVRPTTFVYFFGVPRSIVNFISRMASEYGDEGASIMVRRILGADERLLSPTRAAISAFHPGIGRDRRDRGLDPTSLRSGTSARHSVLRTARTCSLVRKPRSIISQNAPSPMPAAPPAKIVMSQI